MPATSRQGAARRSEPVRIVVMGPSGSGKTTVGQALAAQLAAEFVDGDDLHPPANVAKMAAGIPLDDADRMPWLSDVGAVLRAGERIVVACSALTRRYREVLRGDDPIVFFAELSVSRTTLAERMTHRTEHFMPPSLLDSQLRTLEPLERDERGIRVGEGVDAEEAAQRIVRAVSSAPVDG